MMSKEAHCKYPKCSYPCPDLPDCRDAEQPAQRTWVGLTDEDIRQCSRDVVAGGPENSVDRFAYAIEAKLKEKNT